MKARKIRLTSRFKQGDEFFYMQDGNVVRGIVDSVHVTVDRHGLPQIKYAPENKPLFKVAENQAFPTEETLTDFVHHGKNLELETDVAEVHNSDGRPIMDSFFTELDWETLSTRLEEADQRFLQKDEFVGKFVQNVVMYLIEQLRINSEPKEILLADITFSEADWDSFSDLHGKDEAILKKEQFVGLSLRDVITGMILRKVEPVETVQENKAMFFPTGPAKHADGSLIEADIQTGPGPIEENQGNGEIKAIQADGYIYDSLEIPIKNDEPGQIATPPPPPVEEKPKTRKKNVDKDDKIK